MGITSPYYADRQRQPTTRRALSGRRAKWEMVGVGGFEPPASRSRTVRSSLTELHPDQRSRSAGARFHKRNRRSHRRQRKVTRRPMGCRG